ncbi:DUF6397 family protein [Streptomyces sp. VNUA24]|uniref:DUF6397 family protein n=1 Tax=Streptomyces sp. VNUA24 TaxID=3031131 RepID=UPI0023B79133|nr:DUF6397 family protein [Streptomyces sp. VNUA24]WEH19713.1 DUF6397 family protein [Streptomyces sp. VNUA24]
MSGDTVTRSTTHGASATTTSPGAAPVQAPAPSPARANGRTLAPGRAARELGLKRSELDLAVHLGCLRTVDEGGARRIAQAEIDRLRAAKGFPETLRARVDAVSSLPAAQILGVAVSRFTRLARLGLVTPVAFSVNRYRTVVWLYLAAELRQFAADEKNARWLTGRMPQDARRQLGEGLDLRPRNWRGRQLGFLLRQSDDPWRRAAAPASLLDPIQVAQIVQDPYERAELNHHRPFRADHSPPDSPTARIIAGIRTADDPDEIAWLRTDLLQALAEARAHRLAPRSRRKVSAPTTARRATPAPSRAGAGRHPGVPRPTAGTAPEGLRGLLGRLRRGPRASAGRSGAELAEQPFLDDRHQQAALQVVDTAAGQPPAAHRDR